MDTGWHKNIPFTKLFILLMLLFVAACSRQELLSNIDPKQSIEILVVLKRAGIRAEREKRSSSRQESYRVNVDQEDYSKAMEVLHEYGLPRRNQEDLTVLVRQQGLMPDSAGMSALRRELAVSLQVEKLLLGLPGVVDARVVVRDEPISVGGEGLGGNLNMDLNSRATVVLRYVSENLEPSFSLEEVKHLVTKAVRGLQEQNVTLTVTRVLSDVSGTSGSADTFSTFSPFRFRIMESDLKLAKRQILGVVLAVMLLGAFIGAGVFYFLRRMSPAGKIAYLGSEGEKNLVIEASTGKLSSRKPTLMISTKDSLPKG